MNYFYFPRLGAVYLSIPKNACSSVKRSALVYEGDILPTDDPRGDVHGIARKYRVSDAEAEALSRGPHPPQFFTVLSDPLRRYISSYLDKFCLSYPNPEPYVASFPLGANISFVKFLEYVSEARVETLNEHWRHQSSFFCPDIRIDHFFWLDDMKKLTDLPIGSLSMPLLNVDHHSTTRIESGTGGQSLSIFSSAQEIHENLRITNKLPPRSLFVEQLSEPLEKISFSVAEHLHQEKEFVKTAFEYKEDQAVVSETDASSTCF